MSCAATWSATAWTSRSPVTATRRCGCSARERIDVAVLDVMMPGPDGLTLCRSLRQRGDYTVPVILLTALGEEDDRIAGLEAGADDYLTKPFSPRELALRVRSVLRRAPSPVGVSPVETHRGRPERVRRVTVGDRRGRAGQPDQPRVRPAAVLPDPRRHGVHPRGTAASRCGAGTSAICPPSPCTSSGCGPSSATSTGFRRCGAAATCGALMSARAKSDSRDAVE